MVTYVDLFIRTSTETVFKNNYSLFYNEQGEIQSTADFEVLVLGPVTLETGEIDSRFHVNVRCTAEFEDQISIKYLISPDTPLAEWL